MLATKFTLGLDLGDTRTRFAVLDPNGELVEEGVVLTTPKDFKRVFTRFSGSVLAMEAGSQSRWSSELLDTLGLKVYVANPRQLRLIYKSTDKDDRLDAQRLARLARVDSILLHPVTHRSKDAQSDLEVIKARNVLVEMRAKMVNHVRGVLKSFGVKMKSCSTGAFSNQVSEVIPNNLSAGLLPLVAMLDEVSAQISDFDKQIEGLCRGKYRAEAEIIRQVNGVGPITALTYILTLGDLSRFRKSRDVGAFLGLRPRRSESGDSSPELGITRAGDFRLRALLVQCAHYILGPFGKDCDLRRWGLKKAEGSKRAKKRAVIAVARKLSVLLHRLLTTGEAYKPFRDAPPAELVPKAADAEEAESSVAFG